MTGFQSWLNKSSQGPLKELVDYKEGVWFLKGCNVEICYSDLVFSALIFGFFYIWILNPKISHPINFYIFLTSSDTEMIIYHHLLIINKGCVNFNKECNIWIRRPKLITPSIYIFFWLRLVRKGQYVSIY